MTEEGFKGWVSEIWRRVGVQLDNRDEYPNHRASRVSFRVGSVRYLGRVQCLRGKWAVSVESALDDAPLSASATIHCKGIQPYLVQRFFVDLLRVSLAPTYAAENVSQPTEASGK